MSQLRKDETPWEKFQRLTKPTGIEDMNLLQAIPLMMIHGYDAVQLHELEVLSAKFSEHKDDPKFPFGDPSDLTIEQLEMIIPNDFGLGVYLDPDQYPDSVDQDFDAPLPRKIDLNIFGALPYFLLVAGLLLAVVGWFYWFFIR